MERGLLTFKSHSVERAFVAWQAGQHHWRDFVALLLLIFTDLMWFLANSQRKQIYVATKRPLIIPPLYLTALLLFMIAPERFVLQLTYDMFGRKAAAAHCMHFIATQLVLCAQVSKISGRRVFHSSER